MIAAAPRPSGDGPAAEPSGYGVSLAIRLPRDAASVPVIRHVVRYALDEVGVWPHISDDIEIALSEACTNVLRHAGPGDAYDVSVTIGADACELRVIDVGHGFDHASVANRLAGQAMESEDGRGLQLMRALVDKIEFASAPEEGTLVHLVKQLSFDESAPARRLLRSKSED